MARCRKRRFRDAIAAKLALARIANGGDDRGGKIPVRAYRCGLCRGWHLTSQPRGSMELDEFLLYLETLSDGLADDLGASPLAHRVADIIKRYAAALEMGDDWAVAAAVRILVEVDLHKERDATENGLPATRPRTTDTVEIAVNSFLTAPTDPGEVPA